jgi:hypothetical protein
MRVSCQETELHATLDASVSRAPRGVSGAPRVASVEVWLLADDWKPTTPWMQVLTGEY